MKKARIVLSAVAVFAVIGGAFAFKAARTPKTFFTPGSNPAICDAPVTLRYTTQPLVNVPTITTYATEIAGRTCTTLTLYFNN